MLQTMETKIMKCPCKNGDVCEVKEIDNGQIVDKTNRIDCLKCSENYHFETISMKLCEENTATFEFIVPNDKTTIEFDVKTAVQNGYITFNELLMVIFRLNDIVETQNAIRRNSTGYVIKQEKNNLSAQILRLHQKVFDTINWDTVSKNLSDAIYSYEHLASNRRALSERYYCSQVQKTKDLPNVLEKSILVENAYCMPGYRRPSVAQTCIINCLKHCYADAKVNAELKTASKPQNIDFKQISMCEQVSNS